MENVGQTDNSCNVPLIDVLVETWGIIEHVWQVRHLACIPPTNVRIEANNHSEVFQASGEVIKFEGFLKVYLEGNDEDDEEQEGM